MIKLKSKPLIRWTIGPVKEEGFSCLGKSVRNMKHLYPECDFVICYNQLTRLQHERISELGVDLLDQSKYLDSLKYHPHGKSVHWKLYPPRLNLDSHEICMDNDIILWKRVPEIDYFLSSKDTCLIYQGINRLYGSYDLNIPKLVRINSGIYGLPPNFDFRSKLKSIQKKWSNRFDEQGIVASILCQESYCMIPLPYVPICECWMSSNDFKKTMDAFLRNEFCCGMHFVGINYAEQNSFYNNFIKHLP
jgi:hypothetical protein